MGLSVSCSQDEMADAPKGDELPAVSYAVSAEEALAGWQNMPDGMRTRGKARTVADVQTLYGSEMTATRTAGEDAPLGYVVNFEEGGYAVLGVDLRQDPVAAVVNGNSMRPRTLAAAKRAVDAGEEVDAPTFVNAMVADYLVRSLDNNEPRPRIGSWEIKENKGGDDADQVGAGRGVRRRPESGDRRYLSDYGIQQKVQPHRFQPTRRIYSQLDFVEYCGDDENADGQLCGRGGQTVLGHGRDDSGRSGKPHDDRNNRSNYEEFHARISIGAVVLCR